MVNRDTDYRKQKETTSSFQKRKKNKTRQSWLFARPFSGGSILEKMKFSQADHLRPKSFSF